jgi:hypothetical protein
MEDEFLEKNTVIAGFVIFLLFCNKLIIDYYLLICLKRDNIHLIQH